ncbi:Coiled-coil domain-containing protein 47 [Dimargaris cristalligena]|nr:Coiled-coil domain-containing protein 47 [Dimargaris cristalligena]
MGSVWPYLCSLLGLLSALTAYASDASATDKSAARDTSLPFGLSNLLGRQPTSEIDLNLAQFYPECAILIVFALFAACYYKGRQTNRTLAIRVANILKPILDQEFSYVGDGQRFLLQDDPANFVVYGSGRRHCESLHGFLQLRNRHDLIRFVLGWFMPAASDRLQLEIQLRPEEFSGFVYGVAPQRAAKGIRESRWDLKTFTRSTTLPTKGSRKMTQWVESTEHATLFDKAGLPEMVSHRDDVLDELFVTDQPLDKPTELADLPARRTLQAVIRITDSDEAVARAVAFVLALIDYIPTHHAIRAETKTKLTKARAEAIRDLVKAESQVQQERAQQLKAERKKKEADKVSQMTPEAQRKWEEKQQQKEFKRKQSRMVRRK